MFRVLSESHADQDVKRNEPRQKNHHRRGVTSTFSHKAARDRIFEKNASRPKRLFKSHWALAFVRHILLCSITVVNLIPCMQCCLFQQ